MKKFAVLSLTTLISACNNEPQEPNVNVIDSTPVEVNTPVSQEISKPVAIQAKSTINASQFNSSAMIKPVETVACTLDDSTESTCMKFVIKYQPDDLNVGPFCPKNLKEPGGVWDWDGENAGLYRVDGDFLKMLKEQGYTFYDDNGDVYVTDDKPGDNNTCINMKADKEVEVTLLIPAQPKRAAEVTNLGTIAKVGFSTQGVPVFADAPSVLQTGHMPALDVCGGHIDPGGWYHLHAASNVPLTVMPSMVVKKKIIANLKI